MEKEPTRYQDCHWLVKLWRLRFYLIIPFKFLFYNYFVEFRVYRDELVDDEIVHTDKYDVMRGKNLYRLLLGEVDLKTHHYFTMEEVQEKFKNKFGGKE